MSTEGISSSSPIPYSFIPSEIDHENPNKLFLGGVSAETTEKQLEDFFSQFGKVRDVRIVTDRLTAACKGYGFVTFEDDVNVEHLVGRKTIKMNGTKLRVRKAIRRNASQFDHVSPSKKWFMLPTNFVHTQQQPSSFLTPPNTPPSMEQLSLYESDSLRGQSVALSSANRYLYRNDNMEGYPMMYANNGLNRSRTNSSPPAALRVTPPSIIIPEDEPAFFFPQPHPIQHQQQQVDMSRARTYSTPITMQDYEVLRQQHELQYQPPQTLLVPTNQAPPKYLPQPPLHQQHPKATVGSQQYFMPLYRHHQQHQQPGHVSPGKNIMYCVPHPETRYPNNGNLIFKS